MSITKFSPQDVSLLAERLNRLEQDIKNLKMERKVLFSDAVRIIDAGINKDADILIASLVVPEGKKVIFQYAFDSKYKWNDSDVVYTYSQGEDPFFPMLLSSIILPVGIDKDFIHSAWVIGINNGTWHAPVLTWTTFTSRTFATKSIFTAGTYSNLKFYCRDLKHETQAEDIQENTYWGFWIAYEVKV